jgi:hypothetical protein
LSPFKCPLFIIKQKVPLQSMAFLGIAFFTPMDLKQRPTAYQS